MLAGRRRAHLMFVARVACPQPARRGGPLLRGHVPGMGDSMPSERRAGHATLNEQGLPQNLGTPSLFAGDYFL